jgi:hypothetical protein
LEEISQTEGITAALAKKVKLLLEDSPAS